MLSQLFCPHCHVFCTPLAFGFRVSFSFLFLLILFFFFLTQNWAAWRWIKIIKSILLKATQITNEIQIAGQEPVQMSRSLLYT